jgi:hypothetical protein
MMSCAGDQEAAARQAGRTPAWRHTTSAAALLAASASRRCAMRMSGSRALCTCCHSLPAANVGGSPKAQCGTGPPKLAGAGGQSRSSQSPTADCLVITRCKHTTDCWIHVRTRQGIAPGTGNNLGFALWCLACCAARHAHHVVYECSKRLRKNGVADQLQIDVSPALLAASLPGFGQSRPRRNFQRSDAETRCTAPLAIKAMYRALDGNNSARVRKLCSLRADEEDA